MGLTMLTVNKHSMLALFLSVVVWRSSAHTCISAIKLTSKTTPAAREPDDRPGTTLKEAQVQDLYDKEQDVVRETTRAEPGVAKQKVDPNFSPSEARGRSPGDVLFSSEAESNCNKGSTSTSAPGGNNKKKGGMVAPVCVILTFCGAVIFLYCMMFKDIKF